MPEALMLLAAVDRVTVVPSKDLTVLTSSPAGRAWSPFGALKRWFFLIVVAGFAGFLPPWLRG